MSSPLSRAVCPPPQPELTLIPNCRRQEFSIPFPNPAKLQENAPSQGPRRELFLGTEKLRLRRRTGQGLSPLTHHAGLCSRLIGSAA